MFINHAVFHIHSVGKVWFNVTRPYLFATVIENPVETRRIDANNYNHQSKADLFLLPNASRSSPKVV